MADEVEVEVTETETGDQVEIRLAPKDIAINSVFAGLRGDRNGEKYQAQVKRLSKVLEDEGQLQPVLIRTNTTGSDHGYELVFGHRRHEAAQLADLDLLCKFADLDDADAMKAALRENIQSEDFTDMDKARIILGLRVNGKMKTKVIAEYLGVSTATVTETEKLLDLPEDVREKVEAGIITKSAALELAPVAKEKRQEVMEKAQEAAESDQGKGKGRGKDADAATDAQDGKKPSSGKAKVQAKHVRKAAKAVAGAVAKPKAPNRATIIEMLEELTGPAVAKPMAILNGCWLAWIEGKLSDKQLKSAHGDVEDCIASKHLDRDIPAAKVLAALEKPKKLTAAQKTEAKVRKALDIAKGKSKKKAPAKAKAKKPAKVKAKVKKVKVKAVGKPTKKKAVAA